MRHPLRLFLKVPLVIPSNGLKIHYLAALLRPLHGTPVENHWTRHIAYIEGEKILCHRTALSKSKKTTLSLFFRLWFCRCQWISEIKSFCNSLHFSSLLNGILLFALNLNWICCKFLVFNIETYQRYRIYQKLQINRTLMFLRDLILYNLLLFSLFKTCVK